MFAQIIFYSNAVPFSPRGGQNRLQLQRQGLAPSERLMRIYSNQFKYILISSWLSINFLLQSTRALFKYKITHANGGTVPTLNEIGCRPGSCAGAVPRKSPS
jgi:hypothetical protein